MALILAFVCATVLSYADNRGKGFDESGADSPVSYSHATVEAVVSYGDIVSKAAVDGNPAGITRKPPVAPASWPLLNFIFMITGAAFCVLAVLTRGNRGERNAGRDFVRWDEKHYGAWASNETVLDKHGRFGEEKSPDSMYRMVIKIVAVCAATTGVVVWCVTQRLVGRMVATDEYTPVQGVLVAITLVGFILCCIKKKGPGEYEYKGKV
jgi:hypothetical protein